MDNNNNKRKSSPKENIDKESKKICDRSDNESSEEVEIGNNVTLFSFKTLKR